MMKVSSFLVIITILFITGSSVWAQSEATPTSSSAAANSTDGDSISATCSPETTMTARDIAKRMDDLLRGTSNYGRSKMTIITPKWRRTIEMDSWAQGTEYSFIHILSPARERDTTFLKKQKLLYQYIPSAEMRIKISPSMMMQSWMGSDFTNDDLVKESEIVEDYNHRLLGSEEKGGKACYKLELIPKPDAAIVWDKIIAWVDKVTYLPVVEDFYDERGDKVRTMEFSDVRRANDRLYPFKFTLTPLNKEGHQTILETVSIKFNVRIKKRVFSLKNLEKPR